MQQLKYIYNIYKSKYIDKIYNIGIIDYSDKLLDSDAIQQHPKWLIHNYKDRWFADPFIIDEDETTYTIIVETFFYKTRKGCIGKIIAAKNDFSLLDYSTILDIDSHLSFPAFYYDNGEMYVYPENIRTGKVTLYRYDVENNILIFTKTIYNKPLADPVVFNIDDTSYMIATPGDNPNGNKCVILKYNADMDIYEPQQYIQTSDCSARSAGKIFSIGDTLIRPAQDCNEEYGKRLVFQKLRCGTDGLFELEEIRRISINDKKYTGGVHTFNRHANIAVIDGWFYRNKIVKTISENIIDIMLRIFHRMTSK